MMFILYDLFLFATDVHGPAVGRFWKGKAAGT
jgi:hypothetical protein